MKTVGGKEMIRDDTGLEGVIRDERDAGQYDTTCSPVVRKRTALIPIFVPDLLLVFAFCLQYVFRCSLNLT